MMERIPMEVGRVVMSRQGRDRDRCFVILSVVDDQFVMMADGLTRKLDHPKRKKVKHLHAKPVKMQDPCAAACLRPGAGQRSAQAAAGGRAAK